MTLPTPLLLKGAPGSPYTRKMLALLRYRHIAYRSLISGSPAVAALPVPKVELLPTFYLPDAGGQLTALTDSSPLLRRFEDEFAGRAARPSDPLLAFFDSLLEDYADEWLTKAMFHYRWHYPADIAKAGNILPRWRNLTASNTRIAELDRIFSQRQINRLHVVGSNERTWATIEAGYSRFLAAFESHLERHPFLMGARPGASDFGMFGQLTQLAHFDPTPAALTLAQAPRVYAWVGLVEDLSGLEPGPDDWLPRDGLGSSLLPLLQELGRTYVPVMLANARALAAGRDTVDATVDGLPWTQQAFPYQGKCLRWLREEFAGLNAADQGAADSLLARSGCSDLIHATMGP
ncbi:MAG: glutathione S-transferase N-terminal domain-containing protein [Burkholderiaceae bacterium]